ncbi:hypothetical protein [Streptomyces europaeiscabiei]|nr:hypothetical protein OHB30_00910 [Streptomyces europaeiscabiei]
MRTSAARRIAQHLRAGVYLLNWLEGKTTYYQLQVARAVAPHPAPTPA